jgi:hypothetical protein
VSTLLLDRVPLPKSQLTMNPCAEVTLKTTLLGSLWFKVKSGAGGGGPKTTSSSLQPIAITITIAAASIGKAYGFI